MATYERDGVQTFSVEQGADRELSATALLASTRDHLTDTLRVFGVCKQAVCRFRTLHAAVHRNVLYST